MWWDKQHYEEERREVWNPREQWVAIPCPAIIDKQTWDAVQELRVYMK